MAQAQSPTMPSSGQYRVRVITRQLAAALPTVGDRKAALSPSATAGGVVSDAQSFLMGNLVESDAHAGDKIAEVLTSHGVQFVFCLSGGHISPIVVGAEKAGIRVIDCRHEVNAVFAADAVGRLTGKPGVAAVTAGPGITNTITAVKNASMAQSPLVLLGGAAPLAFQGRGALQDIDQRVLLEPIVKKCWTVRTARDIVPSLREAFCEAASGVPGPVFVELPLDIIFGYLFLAETLGLYKGVSRSEITDADKSRVVVPHEERTKSTEEFLASVDPNRKIYLRSKTPPSPPIKAYFRHRFAGARDAVDASPLPVTTPISSAKDVEAAAKLFLAAKRPVLVLGSQSTLQPKLVQRLADSIAKMGAPVFLGGMSRGLMGRDHPCFIRQNRGAALKNCDLVILLGSVVDFRLGYGASLPSAKTAKIISINRDEEMLGLNRGLFASLSGGGWTATMTSVGDPCDFVLRLADSVGSTSDRFKDWVGGLKADESKKEAQNRDKSSEQAVGRADRAGQPLLNPLSLVHTLEDALPDKSILVGDGGDFVATAAYVVRPRGPLTWLDPGSFGTLGVGAGFALAAKLVCPDAEVWLLWGDGAAGYSIAEFDTFARHNVPVVALIGNDACWGQIERDQTTWFGSPVSCNLEYNKYEKVAEGYGGVGLSITSPSDDVVGTIREAQRTARETGKPVLINALVGRSNFREGSISA
jgi:acetolactate synthase-like protein